VLGDTIMNTVVTVELKRYGWRQKIIKNSFMIFGKTPYVELIRPEKLWKATLPRRNGVLLASICLLNTECPRVERVHIG
jgi:hypothetical protein